MRLNFDEIMSCLARNWVQVAWTLFALYLIAIFVITAHELGHAAAVLAYGGHVTGLSVNYLGLSGVTWYYLDGTRSASAWLVDAAGMLVTSLIMLIAYWRKNDLMLYMAGITSLNSTIAIATSDAAYMYQNNPYYAWALLGVIGFVATYVLIKRFIDKYEQAPDWRDEVIPVMGASLMMVVVQFMNTLLV
jgi:hypothetical protein